MQIAIFADCPAGMKPNSDSYCSVCLPGTAGPLCEVFVAPPLSHSNNFLNYNFCLAMSSRICLQPVQCSSYHSVMSERISPFKTHQQYIFCIITLMITDTIAQQVQALIIAQVLGPSHLFDVLQVIFLPKKKQSILRVLTIL